MQILNIYIILAIVQYCANSVDEKCQKFNNFKYLHERNTHFLSLLFNNTILLYSASI